ncbi:MAG: methyltransferase domain-containing protein [Terriglobia bacterium]
MKRTPTRELLDEGLVSPADRLDCLDDIWRINRRWGGISGALHLFDRFFARTGAHPVRVLDVGAGDGRLAAHLRQRLADQNVEAKFYVLDRQFVHLQGNGREGPGANRVVADVLSPPFRPSSFEVVMCNLFLHHFSGDAARQMLRALAAMAREAVIINDLDRQWLPYLLIRYAPLIARHPISRLDGAASVRQAYTRSELAGLAAEVHSGALEVFPLPGFRNGLILWKTPGTLQHKAHGELTQAAGIGKR